LNEITGYLPHVNATLNGLATVLLVAGLWLIKARREKAHQWVMIACFGVSVLFLTSYLTYHFTVEFSRPFPRRDYPQVAILYYVILLSHILLAITVPFLAIASIWLGLKDRRRGHVRVSKWTFPIWLYVSVTGIVVYAMLYHLYLPKSPSDKIVGPTAPSAPVVIAEGSIGSSVP
jgi:putative membrane protein